MTAYTPCAPPNAIRNPVITSSNTSSAPLAVQTLAEPLEEPGLGRHDAHVRRDGLDDHRRDRVAVSREGIVERLDVVVGQR